MPRSASRRLTLRRPLAAGQGQTVSPFADSGVSIRTFSHRPKRQDMVRQPARFGQPFSVRGRGIFFAAPHPDEIVSPDLLPSDRVRRGQGGVISRCSASVSRRAGTPSGRSSIPPSRGSAGPLCGRRIHPSAHGQPLQQQPEHPGPQLLRCRSQHSFDTDTAVRADVKSGDYRPSVSIAPLRAAAASGRRCRAGAGSGQQRSPGMGSPVPAIGYGCLQIASGPADPERRSPRRRIAAARADARGRSGVDGQQLGHHLQPQAVAGASMRVR